MKNNENDKKKKKEGTEPEKLELRE